MYSEETIRIVKRFQERFSRLHADDIRRLINQSYAEALQQAKELLRKRALREIIMQLDESTNVPGGPEPITRKQASSSSGRNIPPPSSTITPVDDKLERLVARASDDMHVPVEESERMPDSPSPAGESQG